MSLDKLGVLVRELLVIEVGRAARVWQQACLPVCPRALA